MAGEAGGLRAEGVLTRGEERALRPQHGCEGKSRRAGARVGWRVATYGNDDRVIGPPGNDARSQRLAKRKAAAAVASGHGE